MNKYKIEYSEETKYYTVTKNGQHCISSYNKQRCIEYIDKADKITYTYNSFTI